MGRPTNWSQFQRLRWAHQESIDPSEKLSLIPARTTKCGFSRAECKAVPERSLSCRAEHISISVLPMTTTSSSGLTILLSRCWYQGIGRGMIGLSLGTVITRWRESISRPAQWEDSDTRTPLSSSAV